MKKILKTLALILVLSLSTAKAQDIYLELFPLKENLSMLGDDLMITACCLNTGPSYFVISCDSSLGIYPDTNTGHLFIPEYFEFVLTNQCGEELREYYKEDFDRQNGNALYEVRNGDTVVSAHFQPEVPELSIYGMPSTTIMNFPSVYCDPFADCSTCLTPNFDDCYNNRLNLAGIQDGVYELEVEVNVPGDTTNGGHYPNSRFITFEKIGQNITVDVPFPIQSPVLPVSNLQAQSRTVTWTADPNACYYEIYAKYIKGNTEQDTPYAPQSNPIKVTTNAFFDSHAVKNSFYRWYVRAVNSTNSSEYSNTGKKIQVK